MRSAPNRATDLWFSWCLLLLACFRAPFSRTTGIARTDESRRVSRAVLGSLHVRNCRPLSWKAIRAHVAQAASPVQSRTKSGLYFAWLFTGEPPVPRVPCSGRLCPTHCPAKQIQLFAAAEASCLKQSANASEIGYRITFLYSALRNSCNLVVSITVSEVMYGATSGGIVETLRFQRKRSINSKIFFVGTRNSLAFAICTHCS